MISKQHIFNIIRLHKINLYKHLWKPSLCKNKFVTLDLIHELDKCVGVDYAMLSSNPNLTIEYVMKHLDKPWNWFHLSWNESISIHDVLLNSSLPWDWRWISSTKPGVTFQIIEAHPHIPWDFMALSKNLSFEDIINHPETPWNIEYLSFNKSVPLSYVLQHLDWNWDWHGVSILIVKNIDDVISNMHVQHWNWRALSLNKNIKLQDFVKYVELPWNWYEISERSDINIQDAIDHYWLPWNWDVLAARVSSHAHDTMFEVTNDEYLDYVSKHLAAKRIQRWFRMAISQPSFLMCRRRLMREFTEFQEMCFFMN